MSRALTASAMLLVAFASATANAQSASTELAPGDEIAREHRYIFREEWRRFELVDYVTTAIFGGAYIYLEVFMDSPEESNWEGPILFDKAARDAWVGRTASTRNDAALVSDILWYAAGFGPPIESLIVPFFFDNWNTDVAWQLSMMNLQAAAVSGMLTRMGHNFIGRARPDTEPCNRDSDYDETCFGGVNASFPSGHTSSAFVGAGLACAHHANLPFYGGGAPDVAVCAATMMMATGNGVARIVADRHYATDVIVGVLVGAGPGLLMPDLLHYYGFGDFRHQHVSSPTYVWITPFALPEGAGAVATGMF